MKICSWNIRDNLSRCTSRILFNTTISLENVARNFVHREMANWLKGGCKLETLQQIHWERTHRRAFRLSLLNPFCSISLSGSWIRGVQRRRRRTLFGKARRPVRRNIWLYSVNWGWNFEGPYQLCNLRRTFIKRQITQLFMQRETSLSHCLCIRFSPCRASVVTNRCGIYFLTVGAWTCLTIRSNCQPAGSTAEKPFEIPNILFCFIIIHSH